jgi:ubiquinone/menaquinone biosynthesis C-methylase UbiE
MAKAFGSSDRRGRGPRGGQAPPGRQRATPQSPAAATAWDHVASWYDKLVGDEGADYHRNVILPAAMRLLAPKKGERLLDLACGQGVFTRLLAQVEPALVLAVDASAKLIAAARSRGTSPNIRYVVADAGNLGDLADGSFDGAAMLMAVQDIDPIEPVFRELARALRVGGRAVIVMMHPCFRVPRQSSWGWDDEKAAQYRRLDRYATPMAVPIATRPGADPTLHTVFFHRPLATYIGALGAAGLAVVTAEELYSHHTSEPGGHSRGENRARR